MEFSVYPLKLFTFFISTREMPINSHITILVFKTAYFFSINASTVSSVIWMLILIPTPRRTICYQKVIVARNLKKFRAIYGFHIFLAVFERNSNLNLPLKS